MLCAERPRPPPVACELVDGVGVVCTVEVALVTTALMLEEVALGVPSVVPVASTELVVTPEATVVELTSPPVPQGIAEPSGWVLSVGGTMSLMLSVIVNRPVQTLLAEAVEENW